MASWPGWRADENGPPDDGLGRTEIAASRSTGDSDSTSPMLSKP